jgi:hypothetical protein
MTTITAKFHVASSDKKNTLPAAAYPKHATNQLPQATAPELLRIPLPRTRVKRGAGAWEPRLLSIEEQLLLSQSASAAHTASSSARLSALKMAGLPCVGVFCALMDTVTERLPLGLAAMNWV